MQSVTTHSLGPTEKFVFTVLLLISFGLFLREIANLARILRRAKPDADFRLRPLGKRVRRFLGEVLCQAKVIRERPLVGIAHALVFWGFCVFSLSTIDHLAQGLGFRLTPSESAAAKLYHGTASAFAVAVAISIFALAVRRFVVRPVWLGGISMESAVIALLIFALMLTYLTQSWWAHTLALLVFLPVIPRTKHLHLILSPFTVFLRRGSFSHIPPLAGDDDFGLVTGKDITRIAALQAFTCVECGRCMEHCPAHRTGKVLNPKEIALGLRRYLRQFGASGAEPLLGAHLSKEAVFQCTTCGACEFQCPVGVEHLPVIIGLRRGAVNTGEWDDERGARLFLNLERYGNPFGLPASERDKFTQKHRIPLFDGTQEYCLWLGCMGAYDPRSREILVALMRVLQRLGVSFGVLRKEKCTGDAARRLGNDLAFAELAHFNIAQIKAARVKKMLSICPHCVRTIGEDWREFGFSIPIEHHTEFLARHASDLPLTSLETATVFHDPCYLGRYRGVYEAPRRLIGPHRIEPPRSKSHSFCCGGGGGLAFLGEEQGSRISMERAEELASTGADVIAAACPFCHSLLRDALAARKHAPELVDVVEIVARRLPEGLKPQV